MLLESVSSVPLASLFFVYITFIPNSHLIVNAVCEYGYSMAQNLDPNSEGRGVLQFKTGLMSVIKVFILLLSS